jgi:hypothetical protein
MIVSTLLESVVAAHGGHELWNALTGLRIDISIGGPIWAMKGWPPDTTFDQVLTLDAAIEHIVFTPFTRPDRQMVFDGPADSVTMETLEGEPVATLAPARDAFKGMLRNSAWDALHLGYFLGYANWNYFTSPFLFAILTRCSTSTPSGCSAAWTTSSRSTAAPSSVTTPAATGISAA